MVLDIRITAVIGVIVSIYAYYVEKQTERNKNYQAVCDFNDRMNCGKVVTSKYSKMFGVSNSLMGIVLYVLVFALTFYNPGYVFYVMIPSLIGSLYLAYRQYFNLKDFCIVCSSVYIINILLLIFGYYALI